MTPINSPILPKEIHHIRIKMYFNDQKECVRKTLSYHRTNWDKSVDKVERLCYSRNLTTRITMLHTATPHGQERLATIRFINHCERYLNHFTTHHHFGTLLTRVRLRYPPLLQAQINAISQQLSLVQEMQWRLKIPEMLPSLERQENELLKHLQYLIK